MGTTIDGREPPIRLQLASECERGYEFGAGPRHARYRRFGFVPVPRTRRIDYQKDLTSSPSDTIVGHTATLASLAWAPSIALA
jgi:hypothetical protein